MPKIHKLPQDIIAKTAAGEVVERPASVVKELIENSLDAKASEIKILVENGGMSEITVIDDGIGMDQQDSISCLESYTTSKISSLDDLYSVRSLGFRGEALYTMSQVSRITVKSRLQGENIGTEVINEGGEIISIKEVGIPEGT